jgi:uncharacterized coiled-coil DUF342 family protein
MSIEFLADVVDDLESMLEDIEHIREEVDDTWDIDAFKLSNLRKEAEDIRNKARDLKNRAYELITKLGTSSERVRGYLERILPLAKNVESEAKKIIRSINSKDVLGQLFAPVGTVLQGIADHMTGLLEQLRPKLPPFLQKLLPPAKQ